uniref:Uncharacterized protein n=1 Tax=Panagrolaimus superbus TaxID=310955 RepID=A0A914YU04_9BILA
MSGSVEKGKFIYVHEFEGSKAIKAIIIRLKIPYAFINVQQYVCAKSVTAANIAAEINDIVLIVLVKTRGIYVTELKYTLNGYKMNADDRVFIYDSKESQETIRQKIFAISTPKKIIIPSDPPGKLIMKNIIQGLNFKDLIVIEGDEIKWDGKVIYETAKHILDNSYAKCWIIPKTAFCFGIRMTTGIKNYDLIFFGNEFVPTKKETVIAKQSFNFTLFAVNGHTRRDEIIETFTLPTNCHTVKLVLSVDSNNFPSFEIVRATIPKVISLPNILDRFVSSKVPIFGFFANSSVICHYRDGFYQFLDGWNGVYGKDLLISFATKNPTYMENAVEALQTKPSYVVLDLIRIMSMPSNDIKHDGPWNFKFTKDAENPVLIEFDKADGSRGKASPAFLMAMLIKDHLRAIKDEIGEKPLEIGFCLLDDCYKMEQRSRIVEQFNVACKLIKIKGTFLPFIV